jgi:hypothetical protein
MRTHYFPLCRMAPQTIVKPRDADYNVSQHFFNETENSLSSAELSELSTTYITSTSTALIKGLILVLIVMFGERTGIAHTQGSGTRGFRRKQVYCSAQPAQGKHKRTRRHGNKRILDLMKGASIAYHSLHSRECSLHCNRVAY